MQTVAQETTTRNPVAGPELCCNKCGLPFSQCTCGPQFTVQPTQPAEWMRIAESSEGWHWVRCYASGKLDRSSTQVYASAVDAARAAVAIAHCHGIPCTLPLAVRPHIATWCREQGAAKYHAGAGPESCRNSFERLGYDLARLESARVPTELDFMEQDLQALRSGQIQPYVVMDDEDLEAADAESMYTDWRS